MIDIVSYIIGLIKGRNDGEVIITGNFVATDDGNGNIVITEE